MQEPERAPLTAWYLDQLLHAFAADPVADESFVLVMRALRADPAAALVAAGLSIESVHRIPPTTRALRSAGLTLDSFLLRGAELRTRAATPSIFHTAGGAVPLASRLPVVATLLDLAPWELPALYAAGRAARFGHRLRARILHDAAQVIVSTSAVADSARRRLRLEAGQLAVVPLAVSAEFAAATGDQDRLAADRARLPIPARYLAFAGRYDARKDLATLFDALSLLRERGTDMPALVFALDVAFPEEHEALARLVVEHGLLDVLTVVGTSGTRARAAVVGGAVAFVYPALAEATAVPALEALALGVPVIGSRVGALPETIGSAGIVVEPRDPARMASALEAAWSTGAVATQLHRQAQRRAALPARTWADVARETRAAYAAAVDDGA